jgi:hypothetical protein
MTDTMQVQGISAYDTFLSKEYKYLQVTYECLEVFGAISGNVCSKKVKLKKYAIAFIGSEP